MNLTIEQIAKYTKGKIHGNPNVVVTNVVIDSRKAQEGSLFVAMKGERTDGHRYISAASKLGGVAALVEEGCFDYSGECTLIEVKDSATAMGDIAKGILYDIEQDLIKVSVTGSVGKTSTKDMISYVFETYFNTLKSELNQNNELGLPLTVMKLNKDHNVLVTEMGMRGIGQIEYLTDIVKPHIAVITNIGVAHLELLGTRTNILKAKLEICKGMEQGGTLILNGDNDMLSDENEVKKILKEYNVNNINIIYFGTEGNSNYRAEKINGSNYILCTPDGEEYGVKLKVPGIHNVYNSMAAVCAAKAAGVSIEDSIKALEKFGDDVSRQKILEMPWGYIIDDTYNAGPESMEASLSVLRDIKAEKKYAVLGDMLELGSITEKAHLNVGKIANGVADALVAVGEHAKLYCDAFEGNEKIHVKDSALGANTLLPILKKEIKTGKKIAILIKGSNAIKMNIISEALVHFCI